VPALDYWWPCSDKATPSLPSCPSLPLFFLPLNLSLPSTPTPLSYLRSTSRPLIAAKGSGECLSFPVGPGGVRPPNVFWRILSVNLSLFECLTMKHLLCLKNGGRLTSVALFGRAPRTCLTPAVVLQQNNTNMPMHSLLSASQLDSRHSIECKLTPAT